MSPSENTATEDGVVRAVRPSSGKAGDSTLVTVTVEKLEKQPQKTGGPRALSAALDVALAAVPQPALAGAGRWWVAESDGGFEVRATIRTHLPTGTQRLTRVAAGSAFLAARLAVAITGCRPFTALLPEPQRPGVLAVLRRGGAEPPTQVERALFAALVRPPGEPPAAVPGARAALPLLRSAADVEGAWTRSVSNPVNRARLLVLPEARRGAVEPNDLLLVVGSHHGLPEEDIRAGQAVQRMLLTARWLGLDAAVLAGPVEFASCRGADVFGTVAGLMPQVVLSVVPDRCRTAPGGDVPCP